MKVRYYLHNGRISQPTMLLQNVYSVYCFFVCIAQMSSIERVTTTQLHRLMPHVSQKFLRVAKSDKPGGLQHFSVFDTYTGVVH